jgi:hypothetical protein
MKKYVIIFKKPPHYLIFNNEEELKEHILKYNDDVVGVLEVDKIKRLHIKPAVELEEEDE